MTRPAAGATALAAVLTLGACGTTYVDTNVTVPGTADTTTTTLPPVPDDLPMPALLDGIAALMAHLDERIIAQDRAAESMARIDELWTVAEARIRADDPDRVFNFEQAIELARSGVERRRPADASKGYKLLVGVIADYLARTP